MLALANQGADLASGLGILRAQAAATQGHWAVFGATSGADSRYASGSHVDVNGLSFLMGAARRFDAGAGTMTAGMFLDAGYGHYSNGNPSSDKARKRVVVGQGVSGRGEP